MTLRKFRTVLCISLAVGLCAPSLAGAKDKVNRSSDSVNQPVVSYATFIYDVQSSNGSLSTTERSRLEGWLSSINIGYGDHVAIASDEAYVAPAVREGISEVLGHHGLLVGEDTTAQAGKAPYGSVRLILRRASASVPNCPNWSKKAETDGINGLSPGYGCAVNSMLAAMVANPEDLVRGQTGGENSITRSATSSKAARGYMDHVPSGISSGGGN
jgi:pilus assembly protein CpaD